MELVSLNPVGLDVHLYLSPLTVDEPRLRTVFPQTVVSFATLAKGRAFTVIFALLFLEHPLAVVVSVKLYVIVEDGATLILELEEVNPLGVDVQLYVFPLTELAPSVMLSPLQMDVALPIVAEGVEFIVMLMDDESLQPLLFVSTTCTDPDPEVPHFAPMALVPAPELTVPPEIVHEYVLPEFFVVE